jgi:Ca2+-binding RTX toxin-like protein
MAIVKGTNNSETIDAADGVTSGADTVYGYGGNDDIFGLGGDDIILGGAGADDIDGGNGFDVVFYTDSTEAVSVSLTSGTGDGGTAEGDTLTGIENLYGSAYNDTLIGNGGSNTLSGLQGRDLLKGGGGADLLSGGSGDDTLKGGGGADTLSGGTGLDTASYIGSSAGVTISLSDHTASGGDAAGDVLSGIENLTGTGYDDRLEGDEGDNVLNGGDGDDDLVSYGGNDELHGGAGDDWLPGGFGNDLMVGGTGNDRYAVNDAGDVVVELLGEGVDELVTTLATYTLAAGLEIEELGVALSYSTHAVSLTGNEFENVITGNDGDNVLDGGDGDDTLIGLAGNDTYYVDSGADVIMEGGGQGLDEVRADVSFTLAEGADVETLRTNDDAGTAAIDLSGNSSGNVVRGNAGNNVLGGGDGDDELIGLGGQDQFLFNTAPSEAFNIDVIADFNVADDTIWLDDDIFSSDLLAGNSVAGSQFVIGTTALDAGDRIIYNDATGAVFYDSDGTGAAAAVQFATLSAGLALTNVDFLVIA